MNYNQSTNYNQSYSRRNSLNQRGYSNNRRYSNPYNSNISTHNGRLLQSHFENIRILSNIIQSSQQLLINNEQTTNNSHHHQPRDVYIVQMDQLFNNLQNNHLPDYSYNTFIIDSSNTVIPENADILQYEEYRLINQPINEVCSITHESFYLNQRVSMIRNCSHIFNSEALNIWIEHNNTCPVCRCQIHSRRN